MKNIINKIRQVYPVSDEVLQVLQANMQVRHYPKDTYIVQSNRDLSTFFAFEQINFILQAVSLPSENVNSVK